MSIEPKVKEIRKRNGYIVNFDRAKVTEAIYKAAKAVGGHDKTIAEALTDKAMEVLNSRYGERSIPAVEEIQDIVEKVLIEEGHAKTAKGYILYREQRERKRNTKDTYVEIRKVVDEYMEKTDWRVFENSNSDFSFSGLMSHVSGKIIANYALSEMYPKAVGDAHRSGAIHIHDLSHAIVAYCCGWSLKDLIKKGFGGVSHKIASKPPKHLDVVVIQIVNFLGSLQMEHAGAQAYSSLDTLLAPFVRTDKLDYKEVKQNMQKLIFSLNVPSRWGCQPPFTNVTLDWVCPDDMKDEPAIVSGEKQDFTYGDCQKEMDMINRAFLEVFLDGDADGRPFFYPIPTYNITKDFKWDTENANLLFSLTAKYGTPYFQNFVNSSLHPSDVRSMCCRLQLDIKALRNKTGGLFGAGEQTGSIGVVTINLPRIGYTSQSKKEFLEKLGHVMDLCSDSLEIKRQVVESNLKKGLMPFARVYIGTYANHFSTIGINGMHEALINLLGPENGIASVEGKVFALEVLHFMRDKLSQYQETTGNMYNLEAAPCESAAYRFAMRDHEMYPDMLQSGTKESPYYTNSTHLPVGATDDVFEALDHQDELQALYSGGTVLHGFIGEKIEDPEVCKKLVKHITSKYRLPYFTVTPTFSVCPEHGYIAGAHHKCNHVVEELVKANV